MKTIFNFCFTLLITVTSFAQGTWTQKTSMPANAVNRAECGAFSFNGKGYIFGGTIAYPNWLDECWEYDPSNDVWTQKATMPAKLREPAYFQIGNKGYAGTGMTGSSTVQSFYEYDPAANTWTARQSFPGSARRDAVGFSIGNKGYMGTGAATSAKTKDFYEYNPANNTWTAKASMNGVIRDAAVAFTIGTKGYVTTGRGTGSTFYNDTWEYDATNNSWTQKADFTGGIRSECVSFVIGTKAYVGSGHTGGPNDFYEYDATANTWTKMADMPGGERFEAVAFDAGGKGYVCNGSIVGSGEQKDVWEFTPPSGASVNTAKVLTDVKLYPNPATDHFYITTNAGDVSVQVVNVNGQEVYAKNYGTIVSGQYQVQLPKVAAGVYSVNIRSGAETVTKQLMLK